MSDTLRIVLIAASVIVIVYALHKIRKAQLDIDDAIYWIVFSVLLLTMSIFPSITFAVSSLLGIESPSNFVFLFMIFIVLAKLFTNSIELSIQKHRLNNLVQRIALLNHEKDNKM